MTKQELSGRFGFGAVRKFGHLLSAQEQQAIIRYYGVALRQRPFLEPTLRNRIRCRKCGQPRMFCSC